MIKKSEKVRNSNFELLRIVCIIFVVMEHILPKIADMGTIGVEYYVSNILRSFCIVAVNCFVLISGYFGIKLQVKKLLKLGSVVWFWGMFGLILSLSTGIRILDIKKDILYFFPVTMKLNWYVTVYVVLCLLSPILNWFIEKLNKKQFQILIGLLVVVFYLLPTVNYAVNAATVAGDHGYGIINFISLYFIGRYIKLYSIKMTRAVAGIGYILCSIMLFSANHFLTVVLGFYFNTYVSYDSIFCLVGAILLFMFFSTLHIQSSTINKIATYSFATYVIHTSPFFSTILYQNAETISQYSPITFAFVIVLAPIIVYVLSMILEFVRMKVFGRLEHAVIEKIGTSRLVTYFENQMKEFDC